MEIVMDFAQLTHSIVHKLFNDAYRSRFVNNVFFLFIEVYLFGITLALSLHNV